MIDRDVIVTTVTRFSTFDRMPPDLGDPDPTDLDRLAASLDYLAVSCCKPGADQAGQHPAGEAVARVPAA